MFNPDSNHPQSQRSMPLIWLSASEAIFNLLESFVFLVWTRIAFFGCPRVIFQTKENDWSPLIGCDEVINPLCFAFTRGENDVDSNKHGVLVLAVATEAMHSVQIASVFGVQPFQRK